MIDYRTHCIEMLEEITEEEYHKRIYNFIMYYYRKTNRSEDEARETEGITC